MLYLVINSIITKQYNLPFKHQSSYHRVKAVPTTIILLLDDD